jgi:hypothetical protein
MVTYTRRHRRGPKFKEAKVSQVVMNEEALAETYKKFSKGALTWLGYHLNGKRPTRFGRTLLAALRVCEDRTAGNGARLVKELAQIPHVAKKDNQAAAEERFEELIQKLAEILVARTISSVDWGNDAKILIEPQNPVTKGRPDFAVETAEHVYLFEVKCPSFLKHHRNRTTNEIQLPVRSLLGHRADMQGDHVTKPRDYTVRQFLESSEKKFRSFSRRPTTSILALVWDENMYEAIGVLTHSEIGLLTPNSWAVVDGVRLTFPNVNYVLIINRLTDISQGTHDNFRSADSDPFTIVQGEGLPTAWCANLGWHDPEDRIRAAFDAWPHDGLSIASDYSPMEMVMWLTADGVFQNEGDDGEEVDKEDF